MVSLKAHELREKSDEELEKQLTEMKQELQELRVAQVTGAARARLSKIKVVRKNIARILTIQRQKLKAEAIKKYEGKKYVPKEMRPKMTRALRRALKPDEKYMKCLGPDAKRWRLRTTQKQLKQQLHFPQRVFAVKAN